ncbi:MAG: O-antigen ligase family protein [Anaerolineales bacterium]|nr:O-antigen ligase family protein [Anaerolineales bacterium]
MAYFRNSRSAQFFIFASRIAFAITVFFIPFRWRVLLLPRPIFPLYADYTDFLLFASDISMLAMFVFWAFSIALDLRKLKTGPVLILLFLTGLTLAGWVSVLGSEDPLLSQYHAIHFTALLLFFLYIVNEIESAVWVLVPAGLQILFQSFIAIAQSISQTSLGLQKMGELVLDPDRSGVSVVLGDGFRFLRGYGLSDHPNILGGCLAFGLVLMLAVILYGKRREPILASIIFLVSFLALALTFSRSAWISFFVAGSFMVGVEALSHRWDSVKRAAILGALSLLVAAPFIQNNLSVFSSRVNSGDVSKDEPMKERAYLMGAGNFIFVEHSAIGVGLGASPLAMEKHFPDFPLDYQPPHYALLASAMETGVLGGAFYFLLLFMPLLMFIKNWKDYSSQPLIMGASALLLAVTVVGLFDYYTWLYSAGRMWQWLAWGLWSSAISSQRMA